jgi:hypothetical protein
MRALILVACLFNARVVHGRYLVALVLSCICFAFHLVSHPDRAQPLQFEPFLIALTVEFESILEQGTKSVVIAGRDDSLVRPSPYDLADQPR